jgi:hypothetical protein
VHEDDRSVFSRRSLSEARDVVWGQFRTYRGSARIGLITRNFELGGDQSISAIRQRDVRGEEYGRTLGVPTDQLSEQSAGVCVLEPEFDHLAGFKR